MNTREGRFREYTRPQMRHKNRGNLESEKLLELDDVNHPDRRSILCCFNISVSVGAATNLTTKVHIRLSKAR